MDKEKLYLEYFDQVYRFLLKMGADVNLAEELTAETMYRAINNISKFKAECKLSVWLCQIAKNLYLSKLREDKRYTVLDDNIALNEEKTDTELGEKILQKVHELDEPYKEVPANIDLWGYDVVHDWPWWRIQFPYFVEKILSHA